MDSAGYQQIKAALLGLLHLSKDAVHVYVGLATLLLWVAVSRTPLSSFTAVLPTMIAALVMEGLDFRDAALRSARTFPWWGSLHDILNTTLWPLVLVVCAKCGLLRIDAKRR